VLCMTSLSQKRPLLGMSLNEDAGGSFDMVVLCVCVCVRVDVSDLGKYNIYYVQYSTWLRKKSLQ
jgi:hypothetical protein